ncbi:DUF2690 domain-containing protein [Paenarthrobacter ureafaciens]|uniref:DUF2690 domain-containing protein n=2 Tax=Paenarthrobacter ureafaciens TaxID=37931 RepID=UPI003463ADFD
MRRFTRRTKLKMASLAASFALAGALGTTLVAPASASAGHTGTDPATTGCASGSFQVDALAVRDQYITGAPQVGATQLMYSPACGTNWVNVYGYANGYKINGYVRSNGYEYGVSAYHAGSGEHTLQLYAPGSVCVYMDYYGFRTSNNLQVHGGSMLYC